jgi:hypothetical protein
MASFAMFTGRPVYPTYLTQSNMFAELSSTATHPELSSSLELDPNTHALALVCADQQMPAIGRNRAKSPEDRLRLKQARAERNRASAERSRIKKRITCNAVSERVTVLQTENSMLKERVQHLARVLQSLQGMVNSV